MEDTGGGTTLHRMVPVPEAIRIVLQETARTFLVPGRRGEDAARRRPSTTMVSSTLKHDTSSHDFLLHQTLAQDVVMAEPGYPPYRASIMDGFCIKSADYRLGADTTTEPAAGDNAATTATHWTHQVVDKLFAGDEDGATATSNTTTQTVNGGDLEETLPLAYYITTGAKLPTDLDFDCVVPIEDVVVEDKKEGGEGLPKRIAIRKLPSRSIEKWIRPVGCDIPAGSCVLPAGHCIDPVSLGLLQQSGQSYVFIRNKVTVGVLSTGNELLQHNHEPTRHSGWNPATDGVQGRIPDVNRPVLQQLFANLDICQVHDLGTCRDDDVAAMANTIRQALETCDVIVTTGGISMGEADIVEDVLVNELGGTLHFGRLHMKPGKPSTFVTLPFQDNAVKLVFALPGNPVSAVVCSHLLVRPCLQLLYEGPNETLVAPLGTEESFSEEDWIARVVQESTVTPPEIRASLGHDIPLDPSRPEYHRVQITFDATANTWIATSTGVQRSSRLLSLRDADALVALPQASPSRPKALQGETFPTLLLKKFFVPMAQKVSQSFHLGPPPTVQPSAIKVDIVHIVTDEEPPVNLEDRVLAGLGSSTATSSGSFVIVSTRTHRIGHINTLYDFIASDSMSDVHVVVASCRKGSFATNCAVSAHVKAHLIKVTDAIALQARHGAALQHPASALFESVVGIVPDRSKSLLILIPLEGLEGALERVRGLLRHCLKIAKG